jgi:sugar-specific transcriptional regulator TrmB
MKQDALRHVLESVGMEEEEALLYLAGLALGCAPASAYAQKTKMNRVTAYNHLERMVQSNHMTQIVKNKTKWYTPISPDQLLVETQNNTLALDRSLSDLHRKPHVRYYEGMEGIRHIYNNTLTAKSEIRNFANSTIIRNFWKEYDAEYVAQRVERGIFLKGIAPDDALGRRVHGMDKENKREIRLVSAVDFPLNGEINMYDNKVAIINFSTDPDDIFGVIIESKEVADTQNHIFEMAWRYAILGDHKRAK